METLTSEQIIKLLVAITLMLGLGRAFGELFRKIKQPAVVGEILAGIILGPTIFGMISPDVFRWVFPAQGEVAIALDAIVTLSIIFMLLVVGFEIDLGIVLQQGKAALLTGSIGMLLPFVLGGGVAYLFPKLFVNSLDDKVIFAVFIGTSLSISALPIIARTLMDLNIFKSKIGMMIMAASMFNDFVGWIAFSIFLGLVGSSGGHSHGMSVGWTIGLTLGFVVFMLIFMRKVVHYLLPFIQSKLSWPGGILSFGMVFALIGAAITEKIGVHSIFGAFIVGVAIGDSTHVSERTKEIINQFITNIFAPLFFVSIGLKVNFIEAFNPVVVIVILVLGFAGKVIGCGVGARWSGFGHHESMAVGFAMNARGVLEIVLGLVALNTGIIGNELFVAIIVLVLFSSVLSGPLMSIYTKDIRSYSFIDLLDSRDVVFTEAKEKQDVIRELVDITSSRHKLDKEAIYDAVMKREEAVSTGIGNYIAIPHAKVDVKKPVLAAAISKKGIDFQANDEDPARVILLLLTPVGKNELQLQLLAQVAGKFKDKEASGNLAEVKTAEEFLSKLKQI